MCGCESQRNFLPAFTFYPCYLFVHSFLIAFLFFFFPPVSLFRKLSFIFILFDLLLLLSQRDVSDEMAKVALRTGKGELIHTQEIDNDGPFFFVIFLIFFFI